MRIIQENQNEVSTTTVVDIVISPQNAGHMRTKGLIDKEVDGIIEKRPTPKRRLAPIDIAKPRPPKRSKPKSDKVVTREFKGLNRTIKWLINCDCALVTAWRGDRPRRVNDQNNKKLQKQLRSLGYGVYKVRGFYAEVGKPVNSENSFLVFDQNKKMTLKEDVRALSEAYGQDCFIFKSKDDENALLIGTNDDFGRDETTLGRARINATDSLHFSKVGSGTISFSS